MRAVDRLHAESERAGAAHADSARDGAGRLHAESGENDFRPAREAWLNRFARMARPAFARIRLEYPALKLSTGYISASTLGRTYHHAVSTAEVYEIQVCLNDDDGVRVAGTLTHEPIHACGVWNHGKASRDAGRALGLEGKPTEMGWDHGDAGKLPAWARKIVGKLGPYPAGRISLRDAVPAEPGKPGGKPSPTRPPSATPTGDRPVIVGGPRPQRNRQIKAECAGCGFVFRASRKWLEAGRRLRCPDAACDGAVTVKAPPA